MMLSLIILKLILLPILTRQCGGGVGAKLLYKKGSTKDGGIDRGGIMPHNISALPELLFALCIALTSLTILFPYLSILITHKLLFLATNFILGLLITIWSWLWMETGHGTAFHMGYKWKEVDTNRIQTLSPLVDFICKVLNVQKYKKIYCWIFMGIKGLLISLPLGIWCIPMAFLWPLSYELGWIFYNRGWHIFGSTRTDLAEFISGFFLASVIILSLLF